MKAKTRPITFKIQLEEFFFKLYLSLVLKLLGLFTI